MPVQGFASAYSGFTVLYILREAKGRVCVCVYGGGGGSAAISVAILLSYDLRAFD